MTADPAAARLSIYEAAAANRVRTAALLAAFTLLLVVLGYVLGEHAAPGAGLAVAPFALRLSTCSAAGSSFAGDQSSSG